MADLTKQEKELMLELIDDAYANQMIVIEESVFYKIYESAVHEQSDKLRLDEIGRLHDTIQARLDRQLAIINKNK